MRMLRGETYEEFNRRMATEAFNRSLRGEMRWPSGLPIADKNCKHGCPESDHDPLGRCFRDCGRCPDDGCWM